VADLWHETVSALSGIFSAHGPAVNAAHSFAPGDYSIHFFLQLAVIILACRVVGWIGQKFLGQPQVVGEMIAGVVLGPSLLGLLLPDLQGAIFGGYSPRVAIPELLGLYQEGRLKLDELVTNRYALDDIGQGFQDMLDGKNIRGVVVHEH